MKNYDLVVVGSGVGLTVLGEGLNAGMSCALVESGKMGGTCLTRGCIPSKVLTYPADLIRAAEDGKRVGVHLSLTRIDWETISKRMWSQIDESMRIEESLNRVDGLDVYRGVGEFVGDYQMRVRLDDSGRYSDVFKGDRFVLASGARSMIPPIEGIDKVDYITTESFFGPKFPKKPWESLVIIGGGIVAAEFAHMFSAFGTRVTIIEMLPRLVASEEPEVSELLERAFRRRMTVLTNTRAIAVRQEGDLKIVTAKEQTSNKTIDVSGEALLIAVGRRSNADILRVEKTGVKTDAKGWIVVDEYLQTSRPGIWAIGDATGRYQFRHKANYDADIVTRNIFGDASNRVAVDYSAVPWAIFTYPQIAHVGMTEREAIEKGHEIYVAKKHYSSVAKGFAMGFEEGDEDDGFFKLITDRNFKILGAHAIGPEASLLVQSFVYLMNAGFTCGPPSARGRPVPLAQRACPEAGSFMPVYRSMVIHPSLNEVAAWAIGNLRPVNIRVSETHHHHDHQH
ncbi:MAG: dihydrolipoyl dehydrogenase [Candidatus Thorarchaeota archaeon]